MSIKIFNWAFQISIELLSYRVIILQAIIIALFAVGIWSISRPKEILSFWRRLILYAFNIEWNELKQEHQFKHEWTRYLWKPLIGCPMCMVSVYGIPLYILMNAGLVSLPNLLLTIILAAAINSIIDRNFL